MPSFAITPIVRQAVEHRLEELERTKESFEQRYLPDAKQSEESSVVRRIESLLKDVENLEPKFDEEDGDWTIETIKRCIEQAHDDKAITENKLLKLEKCLHDKLSRFRNRMEVSCLHARLMKEAMNTGTDTTATKLETMALEEDFDVVDKDHEHVFDEVDKDHRDVIEKLEKSCTQPTAVHTHSIDTYLSGLFTGEDDYLQAIRNGMRAYGDGLSSGDIEIDEARLTWVMTDLIGSDRTTQERKKTLANYLQSPDALRELAATLNMRSFRDLNYRNVDVGLRCDARKTIHGQHYVNVETEVVDMLFLHCCAVGWAMKLNKYLRKFVLESSMFSLTPLAAADIDKRSFFFDSSAAQPPFGCGMMGYPCPPPLPQPKSKKDRRRGKKHQTMQLAPPMPPMAPMFPVPPIPPTPQGPLADVDSLRRDDYQRHFFMSRLHRQNGDVPEMASAEEVQARLIKTLAVECKLRKAFDGKVHASVMEFESPASTLPHSTIIAALRFLGIPDVFIDLFARALEPKLSVKGLAHEAARTLTPKSGVFVGHGLEVLFSEAVFFFLEVATRKATGSYMYRLYDHCYFVGTEVQTKRAEEEAARFSNVMGLTLRNTSSAGKLSIGFLTMSFQTLLPGDTSVVFAIDDSKVVSYAVNARLKLKSCSNVLDWVREWNVSVGTYAAHLFGPLADVFDKPHHEIVKATYRRIHSVVLDGNDLTTCVTNMLKPHTSCGLKHVALDLEPIIYLPQAYGGLGVKSPFVTMAFASNSNEPAFDQVKDYLDTEAAYYTKAAERYSRQNPVGHQHRLQIIFGNDISRMVSALGPEVTSGGSLPSLSFMTKDEMTEHRERAQFPFISADWNESLERPDLVRLYRDLLDERTNCIEDSQRVSREINRLYGTGNLKLWYELSQEDRWVLQLYSDECFERYGSLDIWWAQGMPVQVYNDLRGHMLDGDDNDSDSRTDV